MTYNELRSALAEAGLDSTGKKAELQARWDAYQGQQSQAATADNTPSRAPQRDKPRGPRNPRKIRCDRCGRKSGTLYLERKTKGKPPYTKDVGYVVCPACADRHA